MNWEEKEKKRQRDLEREEKARKFKESVYLIGDAVIASAEALSAVPSVLSSAVDETGKIAKRVKTEVTKVPGKVDDVVDTINAIPVQVKSKSNQVQKSVTESVEMTKKLIAEDINPNRWRSTGPMSLGISIPGVSISTIIVNR